MKILIDTVESFKIAWSAIVANKARGILTTLGIIIGIVAVTTTMTAFIWSKSSSRGTPPKKANACSSPRNRVAMSCRL